MSSNDLGVIIFLGIMGLTSLFLALKYNKSFHSKFVEQNFGSGDQTGGLFLLNALRLLLPYWVFNRNLFIIWRFYTCYEVEKLNQFYIVEDFINLSPNFSMLFNKKRG
ncbi:hypothetical protein [Thermaerobacillus caldiproteolyticus]|uniref:hypothetical protein n=1 Tax=Thermaerobacillus caldiproteolyticus TaxID=247480 RepID=UPI0018F12BBA|nr:hypothetical protein [Anoxybacillus caldiproteolyticus]